MRSFLRRCGSLVIRYIPSKKIADIILWPAARRLFGHGYTEIITIAPQVRMRVYGDMEDMVNKILLFTSGWRPLAWEPMTARFVQMLARSAQVVVVAGSHIGYYPLVIAGTNPSATVFAFEPNPINYARLADNVALNNFLHVYPQPCALGDSDTTQTMYFDFGQSSLIETSREHAGKGTVSVRTLDHFLTSYAGTSSQPLAPDLLILDAEGYEPHIIRGAAATLAAHHPDIIFELNPATLAAAGSSPEQLCGTLRDCGYSIFIIEDNYRHSPTAPLSPRTVLLPYTGTLPVGISFVNAFATIKPQRYETYLHR